MIAAHVLLNGLIDYAGLFPPASLDMPTAVRNYASYRDGEYSWMLGRFIVPASRLAEFDTASADLPGPWRLSLLGTAQHAGVESVELKVERPGDIHPASLITYYELPSVDQSFFTAIALAGARAKIRTGGLTPSAFPSSAEVARFLLLAAAAKVPFKATAGLHHPIRSGAMHGFLNVFLAAALVYTGGSEAEAVATLDETSHECFRFDQGGVSWQSHRLSTRQIRDARHNFAIGFGSCSFNEPVADLRAIGLL